MRLALGLAVSVAAALGQVTLVRFIAVGEVRPDLLVLVAVSWSLVAGAAGGIWWAFSAGLAADLLGSSAFGATTVSLLPVAFAFGLRGRLSGPPGVVLGAALVGLAAVAHLLLHALVLLLAAQGLPDLPSLLGAALGAGAYTGALALVMYPLLRVLHRRTTKRPALEW